MSLGNKAYSTELIALKDGETITYRPLQETDTQQFGHFLESLSNETRKRFGAHPLTMQGAEDVCHSLNTKKVLRLIGVNNKNEVVGYFILENSFPEDEKRRYLSYGIEIQDQVDCRIAPVITDSYQNKGLGSALMASTLKRAQFLRKRYVVLFGGTHATNERAIHFYEKFGFKKVGEFLSKSPDGTEINNFDMYLNFATQ